MEKHQTVKKKSKLIYFIIGYLLGIGEIIYGFVLYHQFTRLEQEPDYSFREKWIIKYSYEHFGKGFTVGCFFGTGLIIIVGVTIWIIMSRKKVNENN